MIQIPIENTGVQMQNYLNIFLICGHIQQYSFLVLSSFLIMLQDYMEWCELSLGARKIYLFSVLFPKSKMQIHFKDR